MDLTVDIAKRAGVPLGAELESAVFDRVRTCDNHCDFCFIFQLPKGMRSSLYMRDDDYRLSFLYGNFTTLTRFTELDLERVITEGLSPLHVSIHSTDPELRAELVSNPRGATSLRWLSALLDAGIAVHGQVVVCPGVNDGDRLDETLAGVLDRYSELASLCVVPLGVSRHSTATNMRSHTMAEAQRVIDQVESWQETFRTVLGRRLVWVADEYHLMARRPLPDLDVYEGCPQHENGVGMWATLAAEFRGELESVSGPASGFFSWVDGAPAEGYRAPRTCGPDAEAASAKAGSAEAVPVSISRRGAPATVLTGEYAASLLQDLLSGEGRDDVEVLAVPNHFFGGNIAVAGLLTGADLARALHGADPTRRHLLPDVCLSGGRFLDGLEPVDLPVPVEIIPTDGRALRAALS
jgi:NifB/MoaA-like Fe-S oxidoreductase